MRKLALSFVALAVLASPAFAGKYNKKIDIGQKAPDFSGIEAIDGKGGSTSISLADMKEDVVVVVFLANHCPYVTAVIDRLNDFAEANHGKSVRLVAIGVSAKGHRSTDDLNAIKESAKDKKYKFAYGYDDTQEVGKAYNATNTPQFFVLDRDRKVRYQGSFDDSPMNEAAAKVHYVQDAVTALLDGKDIKVTETQQVGCGIQYDRR